MPNDSTTPLVSQTQHSTTAFLELATTEEEAEPKVMDDQRGKADDWRQKAAKPFREESSDRGAPSSDRAETLVGKLEEKSRDLDELRSRPE